MKILKWILIILFGGWTLGAMITGLSSGFKEGSEIASQKIASNDAKALAEKSVRENFKNKATMFPLKFEKYTWTLGGFENVLIISGKIENHANGVIWADPTIYCEVFGGSSTKLGEVKKTVYQVIPVGGTLELNKFNMGLVNTQAQKIRCSINGRAVQP